MPHPYLPIVYVRGYAGSQADVEETVDDPLYGFNTGSTHIRLDEGGRADFFMFVSPFARLIKDHRYTDVIDGPVQRVAPDEHEDPWRTIWVYRYYDPTSKTFDRPGGRRLSIEEAANGLREFIDSIKEQTGAPQVHLVAHSMGGLVCRCLLQKIYLEANDHATNHVSKLFTYGTPHGGILFDLGGGAIEKIRDLLGVNQADDFGPQRMYEFLTPHAKPGEDPPEDFDARVMPPDAFDPRRVFCVVGTNAADYSVAHGLARTAVGPQSDGLVQIKSAYVKASHRAYVHRSHGGRYGMVNSEEGYQNLQRFLFGDITATAVLCDFDLNFKHPDKRVTVSYHFEIRAAVRKLPTLLHERTIAHFCPESLNEQDAADQLAKGGLPLFSNFLISGFGKANGKYLRYMVRLGVFQQTFRDGFLFFKDHIENLPLWQDALVIELGPPTPEMDANGFVYAPRYRWASTPGEPDLLMDGPRTLNEGGTPDDDLDEFAVPLPDDKARQVLGPKARLTFQTANWT